MKRYTLAIMVQDLNDSYTGDVIHGIKQFCQDKPVTLLVCPVKLPDYPYGIFEYQFWTGSEFLKLDDIDGIIIISGVFLSAFSQKEFSELLSPFIHKPIVSVGVDLDQPEIDYTYVDCEAGFRQVFDHLINVHGCRKIAFLSANMTHSVEAEERQEMYRKMLDEYGMPYDPELIFDGDFTHSNTTVFLRDKLKTREDIHFDALICANDRMATAAIDVITDLGAEIPKDVIVIGYDNCDDCESFPITLSTIGQQIEEQGAKATELLLQKITTGKSDTHACKVNAAPFYRKSCGCVGLFDTSTRFVDAYGLRTLRNRQDPQALSMTMQQGLDMMNLYYMMDFIQNTELLNNMFMRFPKLLSEVDISFMSVYLYDKPLFHERGEVFIIPEKARLYAYIDTEQGVVSIDETRIVNPSEEFFVRENAPEGFEQFVLQPIYYGKLIYGYMIYKLGRRALTLYNVYMKALTNSIVNAYNYTEKQKMNTELMEENQKLSEVSRTDELTGILNRRGFMDYGQRLIDFSLEMKSSGLVFYCDMDNLKIINDTFGHDAGDRAIKAIADVLKNGFRQNDVVARMGGDEFAVVANGLKEYQISAVENKIEENIKEYCRINSIPFEISVSMGAAVYDEYHYELKKLLTLADNRQYQVKRLRHKGRR